MTGKNSSKSQSDAKKAMLLAKRIAKADGGFLSSIFSGKEYQSTGEELVDPETKQIRWGSPESAADFFRASDEMVRRQRAEEAAQKAADARRIETTPLAAPKPTSVAEFSRLDFQYPEGERPADLQEPAPVPVQAARDVEGSPVSWLPLISMAESANKPTAQNPLSSAGGLYQFITPTWVNVLRRMEPEIYGRMSPAELAPLRKSPDTVALQHRAARYHLENDILPTLRRSEIPINPATVYLGWFQGPAGAVKAWNAPGDTPMTRLFPETIAANANLKYRGKPYGEWTRNDLINWVTESMNKRMRPAGRADGGRTGYANEGAVEDENAYLRDLEARAAQPDQPQTPSRSFVDDVVAKVSEYAAPRMSDFAGSMQRATEASQAQREMGLQAMREGDLVQKALGAANVVASPIMQALSPIGAAQEALFTKPAGRVFGPPAERAAEVATMVPLPAASAKLGKTPSRAVKPADEAIPSAPATTEELSYVTRQEGPFYRVQSSRFDEGRPSDREISAEVRDQPGRGFDEGDAGTGRAPVSGTQAPISDEALSVIYATPEQNMPLQVARQFTQEKFGTDFGKIDMPESSLQKQSAIGRTFQEAIDPTPDYKQSVFDAYRREMPDVVGDARNYDDLMRRSYEQLIKETNDQFNALPIRFSYHRAGEGDYANSKEMAKDVHGNKHLFVFQGGDPHEFMSVVDPRTGLNANEKFRAVHDAFGHAAFGNAFGAKGEEVAWALHKQMYSPLAQLAMTAETRGQNSFVNYTPLNVNIVTRANELDNLINTARRSGDEAGLKDLLAEKKELYGSWQYAPQKGILLPPEFLRADYAGGMPDYMRSIMRVDPQTAMASPLTHFSTQPGLTQLDPTRYGTGLKGDERSRLRSVPGGVKERSYFYLADPKQAKPEMGLGPYVYEAKAEKLYDMSKDPLGLFKLSQELNRNKWSSDMNPGLVNWQKAANDLERMAKEYGYEGVANPKSMFPMGIMFDPTPVRYLGEKGTFAKGGRADGSKKLEQFEKAHKLFAKDAKLVQMSPDEFLRKTKPLKNSARNRRIIEKFKKQMMDGMKLDPLEIYEGGGQNGRHRAMAAKELGVKRVPVFVWEKTRTSPVEGKQTGGPIVNRALMLTSTQAKR
jgi:hypothetical protein